MHELPPSAREGTRNPFGRRGALAGLIAGALVAPALAAPGPHPDAELIAACDKVRTAYRKLGELLEAAGDDDDAWDEAGDRMAPESEAAIAALLAARATTMDGIFARAAALAETAPHYLDLKWIEGSDDTQRFALLRDIVAIGRASA